MLPVTLRDRTSAVLIHLQGFQSVLIDDNRGLSAYEALAWLADDLEELAQIMYADFLTRKEN